jgi:hypothetical protein
VNVDYLGIDVTENFLDVAKSLYPEDRHRFRRMSLYEKTKKLDASLMPLFAAMCWSIYRTIFQPFSLCIRVRPKSSSWFSIYPLNPFVRGASETNTISEDFILIPMT